MDFLEFNKLAGGVLLAGIVTMVIAMFADTLVPEPGGGHGSDAGMAMAGPPAAAKASAPAAPPDDIPAMLASADIEVGRDIGKKKCAACHTFEEGAANKIGPNLWGVLGADIAHLEGYKYSGAMAGTEGSWSYENLNAFLLKPKGFIKRTKMTFPGLKKASDRGAVLLYLRSLAEEPLPLP